MVIDSIPKFVGMAYAIVATIMIVMMFRRGKFSMRIGYVFLVVSTLVGLLVFAPMLPLQFQTVLLGNTGQLGVPIAFAIIVLIAFVVLSFAFGRAFCGHVCPIGAVQELAYLLPLKKLRISSKAVTIAFRLAVFLAFVILATISSVGLLKYLGVGDFFHLDFGAAYLYVFLTLFIISAFAYRPFCRFLCPYGALLSIAAIKSRFRLQRNENCIDCGKCEEVCPTNEAGITDLKQECYMCNRCRDACPTNAIVYVRKLTAVQQEESSAGLQPVSGGNRAGGNRSAGATVDST